MKSEIQENEKYQYLVDDCRAILTQRIKNSRMEQILAYGEIGERIVNDEIYRKFGKGNQPFVQKLAKDIGLSYSEAQRAIQFYQKYEIVSPVSESWKEFKEGENISWHKIKTLYLPKPKEKTPELPEGKYNVIYADPPWPYGDLQDTPSLGGAAKHYEPMTLQELCDLPINEKVAPNAVLFLWVTSPLLDDCWPIIRAWGFEYKTSFVWDKVKHNMGHYNSVRHELLLVCTRGSFTPETNTLYDSVVVEERSDVHSQKPAIFYEMIENLYPSGKYLELFARNKRKGWRTWGLET